MFIKVEDNRCTFSTRRRPHAHEIHYERAVRIQSLGLEPDRREELEESARGGGVPCGAGLCEAGLEGAEKLLAGGFEGLGRWEGSVFGGLNSEIMYRC
jgi:hypothetical protein